MLDHMGRQQTRARTRRAASPMRPRSTTDQRKKLTCLPGRDTHARYLRELRSSRVGTEAASRAAKISVSETGNSAETLLEMESAAT